MARQKTVPVGRKSQRARVNREIELPETPKTKTSTAMVVYKKPGKQSDNLIAVICKGKY